MAISRPRFELIYDCLHARNVLFLAPSEIIRTLKIAVRPADPSAGGWTKDNEEERASEGQQPSSSCPESKFKRLIGIESHIDELI